MTENDQLDRQDHMARRQADAGSVVYVGAGAEPRAVSVTQPTTAMRLAVEHGVPGIIGECGGQAMCGTCHVKVRDEYLGDLPKPNEEELDILDVVITDRDPVRSRLACQLPVTPETSLVVDVPDTQY
ncbi:2Fe-2S iron-sulfur cluster-binding protein [Streptomyces mutabilis]|uniref:2Fe-2S iron-sulfur cluster-binding protein n=1 Tax=Streptomyces mutabilis TaxID=67332 RepID=UPI003652C7E8